MTTVAFEATFFFFFEKPSLNSETVASVQCTIQDTQLVGKHSSEKEVICALEKCQAEKDLTELMSVSQSLL